MKAATPRPAPTATVLHEAALGYLAQRSASVAQLTRSLVRKVDTWARRADRAGVDAEEIAAERARCQLAIDTLVARLKASGLLDDALYAKQRAERLTRSGKSRRAVALDLRLKGIAETTARDVTPRDADTELGAAIALARKKRIGPFARSIPEDRAEKSALERKWLGAFARGGFSFGTAQKVLRLDRDAAEELLHGLVPIGW